VNYIEKTLELAQLGQYFASPNPMVGCVIVNQGKIVGTGWHKGPGKPHAEIEALNEASQLARGADLYVNLEPCCHHGRTPPCTQAIIAAGIKGVYASVADPNPLVSEKGFAALKKAGIKVQVGEACTKAKKINEAFFHYMKYKTPFVIAKWAMTLDGRIASNSGHSKWITGDLARTHVHQVRKGLDAILVGAQTVIKDNSLLSARIETTSPRQPFRIVLDATGVTPTNSKIYQTTPTLKTLVITTKYAPSLWKTQLESQGVTIHEMLTSNQEKRIDLSALLTYLGQQEIMTLLVEGGTSVLTQFFKAKLIHKFHAYIAPKIIGGPYTAIGDLNLTHMSSALPLTIEKTTKLGDDYLMVGYPSWS
jgi:diaminohydroxyphosphoribosylaminopyrimidine deaminase/5-amino-6-(5-phosphoribosylamino)uracil reductase